MDKNGQGSIGMNVVIAKLKALIYKDHKSRASLSNIIKTLTFPPFNFELHKIVAAMKFKMVLHVYI
jgi:hypothetical protein